MTINERFKILINALNFSEKDAMEKFGFSLAYLRKLKTKGQSFGVDPVTVILNSIPTLNARWFIIGEGSIFNEISDDNKVETPYLENITKLINLNSDLMDKINLKDKEKEMLIIQLNDLKERNIKLIKELDIEKAENIKLTGIIKELANKLGDQCPSEYSDIRVRAAG